MRPTALALLPVLLVGCWPYIADPYVPIGDDVDTDSDSRWDWDDDTDTDSDSDSDTDTDTDTDTDSDTDTDTDPLGPEGTRLTGIVRRTAYLGQYWSDDTPWSEAAFGWHAEDASGIELVETFFARPGRCETRSRAGDWQDLLDGDIDTRDLRLRGASSEFRASFDPGARIWTPGVAIAPDQLVPGARVSLVDGEADGVDLGATELARMPERLDYDGLDLDGDSLLVAGPEAFAVTWRTRPVGVEYVMLEVTLVDDTFAGVERVRCVQPVRADGIRADAALFTQLDAASYAFISVGTLRQISTDVGDGVDAEVLSLTEHTGAVALP